MKQEGYPAPALARGLTLLEQLAVDGQSSLEKLALQNAWPKSSVLRCLQTLEAMEMVTQDQESKRWQALKRVKTLEDPTLPALESARKRLAFLADRTGHCAELYIWKETKLTLIDRAEPESVEVMVRARIGFQRGLEELDATALVAFAFDPHLEPPEKSWAWKKGKKKKLSPEKCDQRISKTRKQGLTVDSGFNEHGIRRFAIPVFSENRLAGVLAIAQRQTPRAEQEISLIKQTLHPQN